MKAILPDSIVNDVDELLFRWRTAITYGREAGAVVSDQIITLIKTEVINSLATDHQRVWIVRDERGTEVMMCPHQPNETTLRDLEETYNLAMSVEEFIIIPATYELAVESKEVNDSIATAPTDMGIVSEVKADEVRSLGSHLDGTLIDFDKASCLEMLKYSLPYINPKALDTHYWRTHPVDYSFVNTIVRRYIEREQARKNLS